MPAEYYTNILYPLQDKAIPAFKDSPFYLTGGTALSRGYYHHRYSDDLDYFVNNSPEFQRIAEETISKLTGIFNDIKISLKDTHFVRIFTSEEKLKIEFINDVPSHIGTLVDHPILAEFDYSLLDTEIKWVKPITGTTIKGFMNSISLSIVKGTL